MIKINITDKMVKAATERASRVPELNGSVFKGKYILTGEIGVQSVFPMFRDAVIEDRKPQLFHYDILCNGQIKVEVKTVPCHSVPQPDYNVNIPEYSYLNQRCHFYLFVRLLFKNDIPNTAFICGEIKKRDVLAKASWCDAGVELDCVVNGKHPKTEYPGYMIKIKHLNQINPKEKP